MHWPVTSQADAWTSQANACTYCMHCLMTSQANACSYCMGSVVLIMSWIYLHIHQGILKGEVSLYHWPPVWLVQNQLYDYWQFLFLFAKQTNPKQSVKQEVNGTVMFPPLVFPESTSICLFYSLKIFKIDQNLYSLSETTWALRIPLVKGLMRPSKWRHDN